MSQNNENKPRRTFTSEFKQQIVDLYRSGKRKCDIIRKYDISATILDKYISQATNTGPSRK